MRPMTAALAIGGACAACCAFPVAAGLGIFAAAGGAAYLGGIAGGAIVLGLAASGWYLLRRRRRAMPSTALPAPACGCAGPELPAPGQDAAPDVIACTLMAEDFRSRAAWIRDLARRHLKAATRSPLSLHLVYQPEAAGDIREMLRRERECCAFLRFELRVADDGVHLLITAPEAAREAADMLFDHFAPDLANPQAA